VCLTTIKVVPAHAVKVHVRCSSNHRGSRGTALLICNLRTWRRSVINFTPRPLKPRERSAAPV